MTSSGMKEYEIGRGGCKWMDGIVRCTWLCDQEMPNNPVKIKLQLC